MYCLLVRTNSPPNKALEISPSLTLRCTNIRVRLLSGSISNICQWALGAYAVTVTPGNVRARRRLIICRLRHSLRTSQSGHGATPVCRWHPETGRVDGEPICQVKEGDWLRFSRHEPAEPDVSVGSRRVRLSQRKERRCLSERKIGVFEWGKKEDVAEWAEMKWSSEWKKRCGVWVNGKREGVWVNGKRGVSEWTERWVTEWGKREESSEWKDGRGCVSE